MKENFAQSNAARNAFARIFNVRRETRRRRPTGRYSGADSSSSFLFPLFLPSTESNPTSLAIFKRSQRRSFNINLGELKLKFNSIVRGAYSIAACKTRACKIRVQLCTCFRVRISRISYLKSCRVRRSSSLNNKQLTSVTARANKTYPHPIELCPEIRPYPRTAPLFSLSLSFSLV